MTAEMEYEQIYAWKCPEASIKKKEQIKVLNLQALQLG